MRVRPFTRSQQLNTDDLLWVIIPCRNEEDYIESCLDSFLQQIDTNFRIVLVDNGSTDQTVKRTRAWIGVHPQLDVQVLEEKNPGTGWACCTGCRYAIASGATMIARTDSDSQADANWVRQARLSLIGGHDFVAGRLKGRLDERSVGLGFKSIILFALVRVYVMALRARKKVPNSPILMAGGNMALTAELYTFAGGFVRFSGNEDIDLHNRILGHTRNGIYNKRMIVHTSLRRLKDSGIFGTLRWYVHKN